MKVRAAVVGATGYTGGEALRYLLGHPYVEVVAAHATGGRLSIAELSLSTMGHVEITDAKLTMPASPTPEGPSDRPGGMLMVGRLEASF